MRKVHLSLILTLSVVATLTVAHRMVPSFRSTAQTGSLAAPTEVTASDNAYSTKVGISWNAITGANLYRVFRNTANNSATATAIGTTAEGTFFDTTATSGQTFFYWVRAENGSTVSSVSAPDTGVRANGVINGQPPLNPPPQPAGNTVTAAKAFLGKTLFWDEQLSSTQTVACGTCHFASNGGSDARAIVGNPRSTNPGADGTFGTADDVFASPGVISNNADGTYSLSPTYGFHEQVTGRKSRSYIDAGFSNSLFWDGRATSTFSDPIGGAVVLANGAALESQVLGPPVSSAEMANASRTWVDVANRVAISRPLALSPSVPAGLRDWIAGRSYQELFQDAYGSTDITPVRIAEAIATFERTLYSDRTPWDLNAQQIAPLGAAEARGQGIFNTRGCNVCHAGSLFSDNAFHNIGVRPQTEDTGRFQVTGNANNMGEFRTPSLRNVGLRGPYFHNGHFATLEEIVAFYNRGGDFDAPNINHNLIRPLGLSPQQQSDLVAFLRNALTDPRVLAGTAPFDRPTLYSESNRVPQITGTGTQGSGGAVPQATAIEPPNVGNSSFTVGVTNALGGASAVLVIDSNDPGTGPTIPATASFARLNMQLSGSGAGQGFGSASLLIPANPSLVGQTFFGRWFVQDGNAAGGVAVTPAFRFTVFGDTSGLTTNAIDDSQVFVTQNYRDFLNREPDSSGLAFWMNSITACGSNQSCIDAARTNVSGAFYISIEFQQSGYLVYRFYKSAFGNLPGAPVPVRLSDFLPDAQQIGQGVIVNQGNWQQQLETNKQNYANSFVQRSAFTSTYPTSMTPATFVDMLFTNAGVAPSSTDRTAAVAEFGSASNTADVAARARALRRVAENSTLVQQEFNRAFVLMQYFGYLRRNPNDAPDGNFNGYNFWLDKLNKFNGDFIGAEMVRAFLVSTEYRKRFGP
ncbi:MAG TPA: cytochrome c peroxidase [Pyrinomonadaceae bacterium]|nr:cytochrome c peroxidase [Pyrinomonadaceae bacterium]